MVHYTMPRNNLFRVNISKHCVVLSKDTIVLDAVTYARSDSSGKVAGSIPGLVWWEAPATASYHPTSS